jgi:hypothetical protein
MAIAGNNASPSLLNALPIRADIGTRPDKYRLVTRIWGPHPGRNPIMMAIRGM